LSVTVDFPSLFNFVLGRGEAFVLFCLKLLGQRKLPIVFPLSGMLCLWPLSSQCASPYAHSVSAARQELT